MTTGGGGVDDGHHRDHAEQGDHHQHGGGQRSHRHAEAREREEHRQHQLRGHGDADRGEDRGKPRTTTVLAVVEPEAMQQPHGYTGEKPHGEENQPHLRQRLENAAEVDDDLHALGPLWNRGGARRCHRGARADHQRGGGHDRGFDQRRTRGHRAQRCKPRRVRDLGHSRATGIRRREGQFVAPGPDHVAGGVAQGGRGIRGIHAGQGGGQFRDQLLHTLLHLLAFGDQRALPRGARCDQACLCLGEFGDIVLVFPERHRHNAHDAEGDRLVQRVVEQVGSEPAGDLGLQRLLHSAGGDATDKRRHGEAEHHPRRVPSSHPRAQVGVLGRQQHGERGQLSGGG